MMGDDDGAEVLFLRGNLHVRVIRAEGLPDTDRGIFNLVGKDKTDPFVSGALGAARIFKTRVIDNDLNPEWDETFSVDVCHHANYLRISVTDKDCVGTFDVGGCMIDLRKLMDGEKHVEWHELVKEKDKDDEDRKFRGKIEIELRYTCIHILAENTHEVSGTYYKATRGNRVTLYQDADTPQLPQFDGLTHPDGSPYKATTAWKDLFATLQAAEKFIYITGWSVFTKIELVRGEDDRHGLSNVGQLLKRKAEQGVKVVLMVWNEKLSTDRTDGVMATHDNDTENFFEGTEVRVQLVTRQKEGGLVEDQFVSFCYSHHQKAIMCDAPLEDESGRKRVVAFVGGLDITNGRYDDPTFPLWSTIKTVHSTDFYNNCVPGATQETGPREPWHDCHAKVEGPIAVDLVSNFVDRIKKQGRESLPFMCVIDEDIFALKAPAVPSGHEGGLWHAQLFRSISADSALFEDDKLGRLCRKEGSYFENSIAKCMVQQIRSAENFIYMENQYFLGSAYSWFDDRDTEAMHTIPREIAQRIVEKIEAGRDFKAYIVVPMFPEGDPSTGPIQEILFWQYRTIESMYVRVADAIREAGLSKHPTDYLNFFCLAKREGPDDLAQMGFADPEPGTAAEEVRRSRRHPIYVHSKMTIVDDSYVLIGSANINQRSLGGNRDTEIAVGAYQPGHTAREEGDQPRGQVHAYRMALWAAHLGVGADPADYADPGSDQCLERVRQVTSEYWRHYTSPIPEASDVHMIPYPINVTEFGKVGPLPEPFDCFPDTRASVLGKRSGFLPKKLTT